MTTSIVFDLDGTLADSTDCIVTAAQRIAQTYNLPSVEDEDIRLLIGQPLSKMLHILFHIEGALLEEAIAAYSREYVELTTTHERLFDGSLPLLSKLREAGFSLAIATGKSQSGADNATKRLGLVPWFDSIHGILPNTPGKPDPAVLLRAMTALNVEPSDCIMVGDTTYDIDLAKAIGVRTVGVSWGVHSTERLQEREPTFFAHDFDELERYLISTR